ncbi:MAG TPA: SLBB domain-containing protein [Bryobacteraceae bacterium]|nr:SLBB domain-containing protein [Bryobacteraceae bacterium]
MGQFRPCTPADFGDPNADCVPATGQPGSSMPGATDLDAFGPPGDVPMSGRSSFGDGSMDRTGTAANSPSRTSNQTQPIHNEKEPPTEFQRYVADSTGQMLPIFGAFLFEHVPATFAPLDRTPVGADYEISSGDVLQIAIWGQLNLTRRLAVDRTGQIILPDAGPIAVAGMTYSQAASAVKARLGHLYKSFDVSVTLAQLHSIQVFVVGDARRPGSYTVSSLSTLVNTIFASGGPSSRGSMRAIELRRGDRVIRNFDLYQLLIHGDKSQDAQLLPGDVILIPPAGPRVAIAGSVGHPGIYEIKAGATLEEALQFADGLSPLAALNQVNLERIGDGSGLQVVHLSMRAADLQTKLQNGDIVRLQPIVPRFQNAVTLRGNVANPGRFPWKEGMRISDLIPDKEVLLTRDYWKGRNALAASDETLPPITPETTNQTNPSANGAKTPTAEEQPTNQTARNTPAAPKAFQEEKRDTQGDNSLGAATGLDNLPPARTFTPRNTVQPTVPEIDWEYAVVERTDPATLTTRTLAFNLGKLVLSHDATQDLALRPGDVVTIFSNADFAVPRTQQAVQVRIEGEVAMAGTYTAQPGETLRQVVERAGGLTGNAYLYGAQFTRESTRREQQKRYDDFLDQLERQINEAASNLSTQVTSPQQAATAQTSLASQRTMVERLRQTNLNGRIVLNLSPSDRGVQWLPDLPLENGDRLYVPSRPSTVNVIGDVFEQASFLYQNDYRTGDYLTKAGGPARSADRSHMLIIRADGSVVSRRTGPPLFAKTFDSLPMSPGDTLIVPTYINRTTFVRSLIDWSQILSNFGLGAAAVNVLR